MSEPFSIFKLFSGFNVLNGGKLGKLLFTIIVSLLAAAAVCGVFFKVFIEKRSIVRTEVKPGAAAVYFNVTVNAQPQGKDPFFKLGPLSVGGR
jgi:hypothetical protein